MSFLPVQLLEPAHQYDSVDDFEAEALDWIGTDPQAALIEIDRELIRVGGLRMFAELAWPQVEADGSWKGNWHIDVICQELENVSRGENLRLGIAVPPRSGKSLLVAVFWPAWDWIEHPGRRWLFASYAQNLSIRDNMKCRRLIQSPWYQARWGHSFNLAKDQNAKGRFENDKHGYRLATSVDAQMTGEGGDICCLPADQRIMTERGLEEIGALAAERAAIRVWSFDRATGAVALKPIVGWHINPGRPIVRITLTDGVSFRCTADHLIWTRRGMIEAGTLDASDVLPRPSILHHGDRLVGYAELADRSPVLIEIVGHAAATFCLTVEDYHTMICEGGVVVSNCVDDPHNVRQAESEATREGTVQWFDEAMQSRLNDPVTGAFVIIQQRVHQRDLLGHVMSSARRAKPYRLVCLPAEYDTKHPYIWPGDPRTQDGDLLWPDRVPREQLEELKAALGLYAAAAQLQQLPAPREGGIFKRHWFHKIKVAPADTVWIRGWDFAGTIQKELKSDPDYTATVKVGYSRATRKWIIDGADHWQVEQHEVERLLLATALNDGYSVRIKLPQDPASAGKALAQNMMTILSAFQAKATPVTGDKMQRALPLAGQAGIGNVQMVEGPWNDAYLDEMTGFPTAAHDDWVDATSEAYNEHAQGTTGILEFYRNSAEDKHTPEEVLRQQMEKEWRDQGGAQSIELDPATGKPSLQALMAALYGGAATGKTITS